MGEYLSTKLDGYSLFRRYEVIDTRTQQSRVLLDTPIFGRPTAIAWSPDSASVAIAGVFLPLVESQGQERVARRSATHVVVVHVDTGDTEDVGIETTFDVPDRGERSLKCETDG